MFLSSGFFVFYCGFMGLLMVCGFVFGYIVLMWCCVGLWDLYMILFFWWWCFIMRSVVMWWFCFLGLGRLCICVCIGLLWLGCFRFLLGV